MEKGEKNVQAYTRRWPDVALTLCQRHRRWHGIKTTLGQVVVPLENAET